MAFGSILRDWRGRRRLSQLALGLEAEVSARHIAFLETGRARPSRAMVLHLAEVLEVPRPARNDLLVAAGFAADYRRRPPDEAGLAPVMAAIGRMITAHMPYPAIVIDGHWRLRQANATGAALLGTAGVGDGASLLETALSPSRGRELFANWGEVGHHVLRRLRTESAHQGGDPVLDAHAAALAADPEVAAHVPHEPLPAVVPARYRAGASVLSLFSTIAQFGSAEDLTIADLSVEMMFPADEPSRAMLETMAGA